MILISNNWHCSPRALKSRPSAQTHYTAMGLVFSVLAVAQPPASCGALILRVPEKGLTPSPPGSFALLVKDARPCFTYTRHI